LKNWYNFLLTKALSASAIAKTKTLIATLWKIPVLASIVLIEHFFANLQDHIGKSTA
jgi:CHAT domain-containing protein